MTRTDIPNTQGKWISPKGFSLIEISWDGTLGDDDKTPVAVQSRPTGFANIDALTFEGDRAAYLFTNTRYFFGDAAANEFRSGLALMHPIKSNPDDPPWKVEADKHYEARRAADEKVFERVLSRGKYQTPRAAAAAKPVRATKRKPVRAPKPKPARVAKGGPKRKRK